LTRIEPNALWVVDEGDLEVIQSLLEKSGEAQVLVVNFERLERSMEDIVKKVRGGAIDLLLFTRNDQIPPYARIGRTVRRAGTGYTAVSPIDAESSQILNSLAQDYLRGGELGLSTHRVVQRNRNSESVSLVFDVEQLGGVRFGLPRILKLLERYDAPATFFLTNLMADRYRDLVKGLGDAGHEVGLHGLWHEDLRHMDEERQEASIRLMVEHLKLEPGFGANFIGRMNYRTVRALRRSDCSYFVLPLHHQPTPFGFLEFPSRAVPFSSESGTLWAVPTSMETYNKPGFVANGLLRFCSRTSKHAGDGHFSVLLHPFRDGSKKHVMFTKELLETCIEADLEFKTLGGYVKNLRSPSPPRVRMVYRFPTYREGFDVRPSGLLSKNRLLYEFLFWRTLRAVAKTSTIEVGFGPSPSTVNLVVGRHEPLRQTNLGTLSSMKRGEVAFIRPSASLMLPRISPRSFWTSFCAALSLMPSLIDPHKTWF